MRQYNIHIFDKTTFLSTINILSIYPLVFFGHQIVINIMTKNIVFLKTSKKDIYYQI